MRFVAETGGQVHADFRPDHTQTGYEDIVHGGVISALMDELLGWPIVLQTGRMCYTGELTVRFLRPVHAGRVYRATANPGVQGGRYWEGEGSLCDEHGTICARARGKYFLLSAAETRAVVQRLTYQTGDFPVLLEMRAQRQHTSSGDPPA
jgi:uncharacterized protein (TIGR00369 family)